MRKMLIPITAVALALAAAGCSESSGETEANTDIDVSEYQAVAEAAMELPTDWTGPEDGPVAAKGIKAMFISCGFGAEGCKSPADGAAEAAEVLGWDMTVIDGQFDPQVYSRSVSQAIDGGYDVIVIDAIASESVAQQIAEARAAGIIVGSVDAANTPSDDGVNFEVDLPVADQGTIMANYMIWQTGGEANAYVLYAPEFKVNKLLGEASVQVFEDCESCTVKSDQFVASEADTRLPTLISSTLRQNPDTNVVLAGYDAAALTTIPTLDADLADGVLIGGYNGISPMLEFIREGRAEATVATPLKWAAWAALDNANRLLQGEGTVDHDIPALLITSKNIDQIPDDGQWEGNLDYKQHFEAFWSGQ